MRGRSQRVEKVGVELMATRNRARNTPKPACLVADLGRKRAPRGVFNTPELSQILGCSIPYGPRYRDLSEPLVPRGSRARADGEDAGSIGMQRGRRAAF